MWRRLAQRWCEGWFMALVISLKMIGIWLPLVPLFVLGSFFADEGMLLSQGDGAATVWWPSLLLTLAYLAWFPIGITIGNDLARICPSPTATADDQGASN